MGRTPLRSGDQDSEQPCQIGRAFGVVGPAGGLQRVNLVEEDAFACKDEGQRQHCRAGIAVLERMEEEEADGKRPSASWEAIFNRFSPAWSAVLVNTPLTTAGSRPSSPTPAWPQCWKPSPRPNGR
ncbi:hypothetical protein ACIRNU_32765 [Streptomyces rochei]|uniref:hypothetical protein n=1 Tax=Streptomyces rochei TaxID=1928 RepID=UPI0038055D7B